MEEKKDTSATGTAATENVEVIDIEEPIEPAEPVELAEPAPVDNESPEVDQPDQLDDNGVGVGESFGDADILSEPDETPDKGSSKQIRDLEQQLATLISSLEEREGQYKRIAADFENFRRRTQKEKSDLGVQIKCNTITELLPVIDNFERARSQIKPQTDAEMNIHKSYQGVYKQLVDCLKRLGVSPMRSEGEMFDPSLHEAVMRESTSEYDEGIVIEDLMRGYILGDRVLRHAMVKVAAAAEGDAQASEESNAETE